MGTAHASRVSRPGPPSPLGPPLRAWAAAQPQGHLLRHWTGPEGSERRHLPRTGHRTTPTDPAGFLDPGALARVRGHGRSLGCSVRLRGALAHAQVKQKARELEDAGTGREAARVKSRRLCAAFSASGSRDKVDLKSAAARLLRACVKSVTCKRRPGCQNRPSPPFLVS